MVERRNTHESHRRAVEIFLRKLDEIGAGYEPFAFKQGERVHVISYGGRPRNDLIEVRGGERDNDYFLATYKPSGAENEFYVLINWGHEFYHRFYILTSTEALPRWERKESAKGDWGSISTEGLRPAVNNIDRFKELFFGPEGDKSPSG